MTSKYDRVQEKDPYIITLHLIKSMGRWGNGRLGGWWFLMARMTVSARRDHPDSVGLVHVYLPPSKSSHLPPHALYEIQLEGGIIRILPFYLIKKWNHTLEPCACCNHLENVQGDCPRLRGGEKFRALAMRLKADNLICGLVSSTLGLDWTLTDLLFNDKERGSDSMLNAKLGGIRALRTSSLKLSGPGPGDRDLSSDGVRNSQKPWFIPWNSDGPSQLLGRIGFRIISDESNRNPGTAMIS
jgi:hypothetical protein